MTTECAGRADSSGRVRPRLLAAIALVTLLVVVFPLRRAAQLAADPIGPKDCGPTDADARALPPRARPDEARDVTWLQRGGTVNDASCLSRTPVFGVVQVKSPDDVRNAMAFARARGLKISAAGVKHSMGGHAFARGGLVLDMTGFNRMSLDAACSRSEAARPGTTSSPTCIHASR